MSPVRSRSCRTSLAPRRARPASGVEQLVDWFLAGRDDLLRTALFRVFENLPFIVPDDDLFLIMIQDIARVDRYLASATRGVDHKLRNGIPGRMTAQPFDNFDAFCH